MAPHWLVSLIEFAQEAPGTKVMSNQLERGELSAERRVGSQTNQHTVARALNPPPLRSIRENRENAPHNRACDVLCLLFCVSSKTKGGGKFEEGWRSLKSDGDYQVATRMTPTRFSSRHDDCWRTMQFTAYTTMKKCSSVHNPTHGYICACKRRARLLYGELKFFYETLIAYRVH